MPAVPTPDVSIGEALALARRQLAGLEQAQRDAEMLLAAVLEARREEFYAHPERLLPPDRLADFRALVERRRQGYPVAYLTGRRPFWSLELQVSSHTLIPRPETETLVEAALERIPRDAAWAILDAGTGSGAVALALAAERPGCRVTATDISREALAVARQNALEAGLEAIRLLESDWFSALTGQRFHVIASNPPYVESDYPGFSSGSIRFEPRLALDGGRSGLDAIQRIIPAAKQYLEPGGWLLLEHGRDQAVAVRRLLRLNHYRDITTLTDLAGQDRVSLGRFL